MHETTNATEAKEAEKTVETETVESEPMAPEPDGPVERMRRQEIPPRPLVNRRLWTLTQVGIDDWTAKALHSEDVYDWATLGRFTQRMWRYNHWEHYAERQLKGDYSRDWSGLSFVEKSITDRIDAPLFPKGKRRVYLRAYHFERHGPNVALLPEGVFKAPQAVWKYERYYAQHPRMIETDAYALWHTESEEFREDVLEDLTCGRQLDREEIEFLWCVHFRLSLHGNGLPQMVDMEKYLDLEPLRLGVAYKYRNPQMTESEYEAFCAEQERIRAREREFDDLC